MALPSLAKTWQFSVRQAVVAQGTVLATGRRLMRLIKNSMIGFGSNAWTVRYSCDGTTAGSAGDLVDRWSADASLVWANSGSAHSWIILRQAGIASNFEVCIDLNSASSIPSAISLIVSFSAAFTGGSTTARPTATDEVVLLSTAAWGANGSVDQNYVYDVMQSSDGQCTRMMIHQGGVSAIGFWIFDKPKNPTTGWTNPSTCAAFGSASTSQLTYANLSNTASTASFRGRFSAVTYHMHATGEAWHSGQTGILAQTTALASVNDIDSSFVMQPIGLGSTVVGMRGRHGTFFDMWWGSGTVNAADTYPNDATRQFAQFGPGTTTGALIFPWDGGAAPVLT